MSERLQHNQTWKSRIVCVTEDLFRPLECVAGSISWGHYLGTPFRRQWELVGQGSSYQYIAVYLCPIYHHAGCGTVYFARVGGQCRWAVYFFKLFIPWKKKEGCLVLSRFGWLYFQHYLAKTNTELNTNWEVRAVSVLQLLGQYLMKVLFSSCHLKGYKLRFLSTDLLHHNNQLFTEVEVNYCFSIYYTPQKIIYLCYWLRNLSEIRVLTRHFCLFGCSEVNSTRLSLRTRLSACKALVTWLVTWLMNNITWRCCSILQ